MIHLKEVRSSYNGSPESSLKGSLYKQFVPGNDLSFSLNRLYPDGSVLTQPYQARIEAVKGGGFHGQVLLLEGLPFVLKTGIPTDARRDFCRRVNWGARDFPYQVSELDAQIGQVKTDLIHDAVFPISGQRIYAPKSFGYTRLPGTFAQAVERLYGRPPRYDNGRNEFPEFRRAQAEATNLYYDLGLEDVGQIHIGNLRAMDNLWKNLALNRWETPDTLSAIR